jgi:hypothetical protein
LLWRWFGLVCKRFFPLVYHLIALLLMDWTIQRRRTPSQSVWRQPGIPPW